MGTAPGERGPGWGVTGQSGDGGDKSLHPVPKLRCPAKLCPQLCVPRACWGGPCQAVPAPLLILIPRAQGGLSPTPGGSGSHSWGDSQSRSQGGSQPHSLAWRVLSTHPPPRQTPKSCSGSPGTPTPAGMWHLSDTGKSVSDGGVEFYPPQGKTLRGFPSRHPPSTPSVPVWGARAPPNPGPRAPPQHHRPTGTHPALPPPRVLVFFY